MKIEVNNFWNKILFKNKYFTSKIQFSFVLMLPNRCAINIFRIDDFNFNIHMC